MTITEMPTVEVAVLAEEEQEEKSIWEKLLSLLF